MNHVAAALWGIPLALWGWSLFGQFAHWLKRADLSKASSLSGTSGRWQQMVANGRNIAVQFIVANVLFMGWAEVPDLLAKILPFSLPSMGRFTCFAFGFLVDNGVDYLLFRVAKWRNEILPPPPADPPKPANGP